MADTEKKSKDGLSLVIGGIFILTLVFATYNYFNKGRDINDTDDSSVFENQLGDLNGEGITETKEGQALGIGGPDITAEIWMPTDYQEGDIEGTTHTVVKGDTLWEIAEAVYGSGFEWTKIVDANKDDIGFLPNGSQALIIPGQVLTLP